MGSAGGQRKRSGLVLGEVVKVEVLGAAEVGFGVLFPGLVRGESSAATPCAPDVDRSSVWVVGLAVLRELVLGAKCAAAVGALVGLFVPVDHEVVVEARLVPEAPLAQPAQKGGSSSVHALFVAFQSAAISKRHVAYRAAKFSDEADRFVMCFEVAAHHAAVVKGLAALSAPKLGLSTFNQIRVVTRLALAFFFVRIIFFIHLLTT